MCGIHISLLFQNYLGIITCFRENRNGNISILRILSGNFDNILSENTRDHSQDILKF